jgi:hypothetical protein
MIMRRPLVAALAALFWASQQLLAPAMAGSFDRVQAGSGVVIDNHGAMSFASGAVYASKAALVAAVAAGASPRIVSVTHVETPAPGAPSCPLTYTYSPSTAGLEGEIALPAGFLIPQYATQPYVEACQFGALGDATSWVLGGGSVSAKSDGANIVAVSSTDGLRAGMRCLSVRWHSDTAAILRTTATLRSVGAGTITLDRVVASGSGRIACWRELSDTPGKDNCRPIQKAIDYALIMRASTVRLLDGSYASSCGFMLGYGYGAFNTVNLIGAGRAFFDLAGTKILCRQTTRPCLNVQGGRAVHVRHLTLIGPNVGFGAYGAAYETYGVEDSVYPSSDIRDWLAESLDASGATPGGLQTRSPLAGFCVDCYAGPMPAAPYAAYTTPVALRSGSLPDHYGRSVTSHVVFEDVDAYGFAVAFLGGANSHAQGDFVTIDEAGFGFGPIGVVFANSNSRNLHLQDHLGLGLHTAYSNDLLGLGRGRWDATIQNASFSNVYQLIDVHATAFIGPTTLQDVYCEGCVRIGNFVGASSWPSELIIRGGGFLAYENITRQSPASWLTAGSHQRIVLDGGVQLGGQGRHWPSLINGGANIYIDIRSAQLRGMSDSVGVSTAVARAVATLGGAPFGPPELNIAGMHNVTLGSVLSTYCELDGSRCTDTATFSSEMTFERSSGFKSRAPLHVGARTFTDTGGRPWRIDQPVYGGVFPSAAWSVATNGQPSWSACDHMDFVQVGPQHATPSAALAPGWTLVEGGSGINFVVLSVGAADSSGNFPIHTQQMNGMTLHADGSCKSATHPFTDASKYLVAVPPAPLAPRAVLYATFTAGQKMVTGLRRSTKDDYAADVADWLAPGDTIAGPQLQDTTYSPWPVSDKAIAAIATVTAGSPGSFELVADSELSCAHCPVWPRKIH